MNGDRDTLEALHAQLQVEIELASRSTDPKVSDRFAGLHRAIVIVESRLGKYDQPLN